MAEAVPSRTWPGRITYAALVAVLILGALLPLNTQPRGWAGPDLILALTLVWVARRPDLAPLGLIAAMHFLADLMFQRPPGLMTALVVILTEILRARAAVIRQMPFLLEWLSVSAGIIAITLASRFALVMLVTPQAPLGLSLMQMVMTILAYPVLVGLARLAFGVGRLAPGEVDALGKPL